MQIVIDGNIIKQIHNLGELERLMVDVKREYIRKKIPNLSGIKMLLTDCDGCLTDGGMYYSEKGDESKKFNTRDGMAFKLLREAGILTGIVTGEDVELNQRRAKKLKLDILEAGCNNKVENIQKICDHYHIRLDEIAYVGDDVNDFEVIKMVGFGCCPNDAAYEVKSVADYITDVSGGRGVIREVAELILTYRQ